MFFWITNIVNLGQGEALISLMERHTEMLSNLQGGIKWEFQEYSITWQQ
jgi:hypothetical protein